MALDYNEIINQIADEDDAITLLKSRGYKVIKIKPQKPTQSIDIFILGLCVGFFISMIIVAIAFPNIK